MLVHQRVIDNNEFVPIIARIGRRPKGVVQLNMAGWEIAVYETEASGWENH